ncbi:hypothetical protein K3495_g15096 [Podosphaera aphanis]|nr:hypothetical protein K3495_g15096 [Podosphaera aphanis]
MVYHAAKLSAKEQYDLNLSLQLRKEGKILTPGNPFEASDKAEIDALIANNVFQFEKFDPTKHGKIRIFRSRLVKEIKDLILTQAPTIQRSSQRLLITLAPSLLDSCSIYLRDITQAYIQSSITLN